MSVSEPARLRSQEKTVVKNYAVVISASCPGYVTALANGNHENISANALREQLSRGTDVQFGKVRQRIVGSG
jgi:hypothetical protein